MYIWHLSSSSPLPGAPSLSLLHTAWPPPVLLLYSPCFWEPQHPGVFAPIPLHTAPRLPAPGPLLLPSLPQGALAPPVPPPDPAAPHPHPHPHPGRLQRTPPACLASASSRGQAPPSIPAPVPRAAASRVRRSGPRSRAAPDFPWRAPAAEPRLPGSSGPAAPGTRGLGARARGCEGLAASLGKGAGRKRASPVRRFRRLEPALPPLGSAERPAGRGPEARGLLKTPAPGGPAPLPPPDWNNSAA